MWKRPLVIVRIIIWICITEPHAEFNLNYSHMAHEHSCGFGREVTPSYKNTNTLMAALDCLLRVFHPETYPDVMKTVHVFLKAFLGEESAVQSVASVFM